MSLHLSTLSLPELPQLPLLAFTDDRLTYALSLTPTSSSSASSGSHSSFLETVVGIATLVLLRALAPSSTRTFAPSWEACAQLISSAVAMSASEDARRHPDDDDGCEVLYGRAGLLYALLRLRSAVRSGTPGMRSNPPALDAEVRRCVDKLASDESIAQLVASIVARGESGAAAYAAEFPRGWTGRSPALMWRWHEKRYLGAAHGVAGILHVLLLCPADVIQPHIPAILSTVEWLLDCQDANGNWPTKAPTSTDRSSAVAENDVVQWCHGAPGVLLLLCTVLRCCASPANPLLRKVIAAVQHGAALVYRHGLLSKGVGLCHGVAGNVFSLLAVSDVLDRSQSCTNKGMFVPGNDYYLTRAVHLAHLATGHEALTAQGLMRVPDHPWSLYEGMAGMCCAWAEVLRRLDFGTSQVQFDRSGMPGFDDVDNDTWASW
ncbi:hypothetical protein C8J57DRAFT_1078520 [Mycena rebaudengoi]|nr:hypothetical protein C8J57DRAFT_1078520 [Mycena rebaudengoi]